MIVYNHRRDNNNLVKQHGGLHIIANAAPADPRRQLVVRRTHSAAAEEGWISMRRIIFTAPAQWAEIIFPLSVSTRLYFLSVISVSFEWNLTPSARARYAIGWQLLAQAIHDGVLIKKEECPQLCGGQWMDAGVGLSKGAWHKQAAALNARRVSTRSTLTLWKNQWMASLT